MEALRGGTREIMALRAYAREYTEVGELEFAGASRGKPSPLWVLERQKHLGADIEARMSSPFERVLWENMSG